MPMVAIRFQQGLLQNMIVNYGMVWERISRTFRLVCWIISTEERHWPSRSLGQDWQVCWTRVLKNSSMRKNITIFVWSTMLSINAIQTNISLLMNLNPLLPICYQRMNWPLGARVDIVLALEQSTYQRHHQHMHQFMNHYLIQRIW